jgi:5-methylcytosine-specific restriction endonuclease McrA
VLFGAWGFDSPLAHRRHLGGKAVSLVSRTSALRGVPVRLRQVVPLLKPNEELVMTSAAHRPVLFLDAEWRPLRVEPWTRAITDFCVGKVEVVEYSKDHTIQGVTRTYPMPAVVRVLKRFKREKIRIKFSRLNIYARDNFRCQFCGKKFDTEELTFDHVVPRSRGGVTSWENIVTCCVPCNSSKADRTPSEVAVHSSPSFAFCEGVSCALCKIAKALVEEEDLSGLERLAHPLKTITKPRKPIFLPSITVKYNGRTPEEWRPYWDGILDP